ncbi:MAG: hypothetical protein FWD94_05935 [Treponema sp.]|nr:hypothetical protein [Treponema sp.]
MKTKTITRTRGPALLTALVLATLTLGCPPPITVPEEGAKTLSGLGDLAVGAGGKAGGLKVTFNATTPAADSYTVYYLAGTGSDREAIIAGNTSNAANPGGTEIADLEYGREYGVVVVAKKAGYADLKSAARSGKAALGSFTAPTDSGTVAATPNPGELRLKFNHTSPQADSYKLYIAEGDLAAADVVATGTEITGKTAGEDFTDSELKGLTHYSLAVVASKDGYAPLTFKVGTAETVRLPQLAEPLGSTVTEGDDPGTLKFSFGHTTPEADGYKLYIAQGDTLTAKQVVAANREIIGEAGTPGVATGLNGYTHYSLAVVASKARHEELTFLVGTAQTGSLGPLGAPAKVFTVEAVEGGHLNFTFGKTTPDADTYTLYYIEETVTDVAKIREDGKKRTVTEAEKTAEKGSIDDLEGLTAYSFVLVAEKTAYEPFVSDVKTVTTTIRNFTAGPDFKIKRGGINPYGHHIGAIDHRALAYSFGDSSPPADEYRIYYAEGADLSAEAVMAGGKFVERTTADPGYVGGVDPGWVSETDTYTWTENRVEYTGDYVKKFSFTIPEDAPVFEIDREYSAVVVARKAGYGNIQSEVISIGKVPNRTLTIDDLEDPPEVHPVYGTQQHVRIAVVLSGNTPIGLSVPQGRRPLGVGYRDPGTKTFVFYELDIPNNVIGQYDPTKPWTKDQANRPVALSDTERQPPGLTDGRSDGHFRYITTNGGTSFGMPTPLNVTISMVMEFPWKQFGRQ